MNYSQTFFSRQFLWEIVRIITVGVASLLFSLEIIPLPVLLVAMAFGLYLISNSPTGNQWFFNNTVINGATGQGYIATLPGSYYVEVTNSDECSSVSDSVNVNSIGIIENSSESNFNVFPNPTNGFLTIEFEKIENNYLYVEIINETGQVILKTTITDCFKKCTKTLDLRTLKKGEYTVRIIDSNEITTKKVVLN